MKDIILSRALFEDTGFGHTNPQVTSPTGNTWLEKARQVILDRTRGVNSKNFRHVGNFKDFRNSSSSKNFSSIGDRISRNIISSKNFWYVWAMGYLGGSSNSSNRTSIKAASETIIRISILAKAVVGMKINTSSSCHFGE